MSEQNPHIFLLPSNVREAVYEYLSQRPFREVHGLCAALKNLRRVNLTSMTPPDIDSGESGESGETDRPGAEDEKSSTSMSALE